MKKFVIILIIALATLLPFLIFRKQYYTVINTDNSYMYCKPELCYVVIAQDIDGMSGYYPYRMFFNTYKTGNLKSMYTLYIIKNEQVEIHVIQGDLARYKPFIYKDKIYTNTYDDKHNKTYYVWDGGRYVNVEDRDSEIYGVKYPASKHDDWKYQLIYEGRENGYRLANGIYMSIVRANQSIEIQLKKEDSSDVIVIARVTYGKLIRVSRNNFYNMIERENMENWK